jgi:hypothetical protein
MTSSISRNRVTFEGLEPAAFSVRSMREGLSVSSSTLFGCFLLLYTRESGVKTIKMSVFYHDVYFALHTVAHGCTQHEEGNADPTLSSGKNLS